MDIVIQNGRVIDPAAGINEICSVGIEGAKIVDISAGHLDGKYTINADGCIVTPGLIDFHTHLFEGGSLYGIHPDCLLSQGVTAAVDAGTSGSAGFEAFYRSIIQNSILTVKAFISLGATGKNQALNAHNFSLPILSNFDKPTWPPSCPMVGSLRVFLFCSPCSAPLTSSPFDCPLCWFLPVTRSARSPAGTPGT